ncbi:MAG: hypothetical protein HKN80_02820, partial [Acidimicrobiia bacterium]|nr:hypothetical protein [Acidimicrobiia bacterium]
WTLRAAITLLVIAAGLPALLRLRRTPHRLAALLAASLLIVALASVAASGDPTRSFFGHFGWAVGWLPLAGLVSAWALGAVLTASWVRRVETTVLIAVAFNGLIAVLQTAFRPPVPALEVVSDRAAALTGNPVILGGLLAAGAGLAVARHRPRAAALMAAPLAFAAMTTASRSALLALIAVTLYAIWHHRWLKGVAIAGALVLAVGGGILFTDAMSRDVESVARLSSDGGIAVRLDLWATGAEATLDRPVIGSGPGLFRDAVTPLRSLEEVAAQASGDQWIDAHNVVVEFAVTTGLLGLLLLLGWLGVAGWRARGPLALFALVALGVHLLQPMSLVLTTLALLALGASMTRVDEAGPTWRSAGAAIPAVLCGAVLLFGAFQLDSGRVDFKVGAAESAARLLPMYPDAAVAASRAHSLRAIETRDPAANDMAVEWRVEAIDRDPTSAFLWQGLGEIHLAESDWVRAEAAFTQALVHDPWLSGAHVGLVRVAIATLDTAAAASHLDVIDALGFDDVADELRLQLESAAG